MSYRLIQDTLEAHLSTYSNLPPIYNENEKLANDAPYYLRTTVLPDKTRHTTLGLSGIDEYPGIFQIDFFYRLNEGSDAVNYFCDEMISHFDVKTILTNGNIKVRINKVWRDVQMESDTHYHVPLVIEYSVYIAR